MPAPQASARRSAKSARLVVDGGVVPEALQAQGALGRAAGDADGPAADDLGDLADAGADGAGGRRHRDGLAGARHADLQQPVVRGDAVDAEDAERGRQRQVRLVDPLDRTDVGDGPVLPAEHPRDRRAHRQRRVVRRGDVAGGDRAHHGADRHRLRIVGDRIDPAAHRRLDRQKGVADQHLARSRHRHRALDDPEVVRLGDAFRAAGEQHLTVDGDVHRIAFIKVRPELRGTPLCYSTHAYHVHPYVARGRGSSQGSHGWRGAGSRSSRSANRSITRSGAPSPRATTSGSAPPPATRRRCTSTTSIARAPNSASRSSTASSRSAW